jgi:hypothetical protein
MILSPVNCSEKISPYEREGDIEQERAEEIDGVKPGGVGRGVVTCREASEVLHLSLRHTRRLLAAYRKEGTAALAHGNRGKKPPTHAARFGTIFSIQCLPLPKLDQPP